MKQGRCSLISKTNRKVYQKSISNGPQKTDSTPQIFQKKLQRIFTFVSAMVKRHAG